MEKRLVKNSIILLSMVAYIFLFKTVIITYALKYSNFINASFLAILLAVSIFFLGYRKDKSTVLFQNIFKYTAFYVLLTGFAIYGIGFFVGFLKNAYSREFLTLVNNVVIPIIVYILLELIRYVFIWANKDKKAFIVVLTIIIIAFELVLKVRSFNFEDFEALFRFASSTFLPTIVKNVFFTYVCYHVGYRVPIFYRMLTDVFYVYIVPIIPDLGEYLHSIIAITLPVIIYINIYEMVDSKCDKPRPLIQKKGFSFPDFAFGALLVLMVCLVSGLFPIYMIGIGSSSMSPTINKGDAVVIQKINPETGIKEGDIIAYTKSDRDDSSVIIVHRVSEITTEEGAKAFVTKGDANKTKDVSLVKAKQIKGIVRFRIPLIAYPTILVNDYMENWR